MAAESILTYKKPGFPVLVEDSSGARNTIEYIGPTSTLESAKPSKGEAWGDYAGVVESTEIEPIGGTDYSGLTITMRSEYEAGGDGTTPGIESVIRYEIEWAVFSRSLYEHPAFLSETGGQYALTVADYAALQLWESNQDVVKKSEYKYIANPSSPSTFTTLSVNAKMFAKGIFLGQENWEDVAPVIRKTTTYLGGIPGQSSAGLKDNPPSNAGGPAGYEWKKTADRSIQSNDEFDWDRVEEWTGAKKILTDRAGVYWSAP